MAKKRYRRRKNRGGGVFLTFSICTLIVLLGGILVVRIVDLKHRGDPIVAAPSETPEAVAVFAESEAHAQTLEGIIGIETSEAPLPGSSAAPVLTQEPSLLVEATPIPQGDAEPFVYLPVYEKAETSQKRIAITVDDCYQLENLKTIARTAYQNKGRLTLFPIGENVVKEGMAEVLQTLYFKLGFEIENHTWDHARVFRMSEAEMAEEIWKQSEAVSRALGVNYHEHFFRLMGGDGANDQRTHNYLKQLGFLGIAYWSWSGSDATLEQSKEVLAPGMVYLFHTTDRDTEILREFIPYCVSQGYQLVTMNELFGLPSNEVADISTLAAEMPQPQAYTVEYHDEKEGDYSWAVVRIQERLHELGYLGDSAKSALKGTVADGVYGQSTAAAISRFQQDHGLQPTGIADPTTQRILLEGESGGDT